MSRIVDNFELLQRPGFRRIFAVAAALFCLASLGGTARAGDYDVMLCSHTDNSAAQNSLVEPNSSIITLANGCGSGGGIGGTVKSGTSSGKGAQAGHTWNAPEGTSIESLRFSGNLKDQYMWASRVTVWGKARFAWRPTAAPVAGYRVYDFDSALTGGRSFSSLPDTGYSSFGLKTICNPPNAGDRCSRTNVNAYGFIKDVQLGLRDSAAPQVRLTSQRMFTEVNYGETGNITIDASDKGSGVAGWTISVNGRKLPTNVNGDRSFLDSCKTSPRRAGIAIAVSPCPLDPPSENIYLFTNDDPFKVGENEVEVCVTDFSGNQTCDHGIVSVKPLPVQIDQGDTEVTNNGGVAVVGRVGGVENANVSGVIEVYDPQAGTWETADRWKSAASGKLTSRIQLNRFKPAAESRTNEQSRKCRKIARKMKVRNPKTGKVRAKVKRVRRCNRVTKSVLTGTYEIRARVTNAPKGYAGGTSEVERVVLRSKV